MEAAASSDPIAPAADKICVASEGTPGSGKKRHRNRKRSGKSKKSAESSNSKINLKAEHGSVPNCSINQSREQTDDVHAGCCELPNAHSATPTSQPQNKGQQPSSRRQKANHKPREKVGSDVVRPGSGKQHKAHSAPKTTEHCEQPRQQHSGKDERNRQTPGQREQQTPGQREQQTPGHREQQTPGQREQQTPGQREQQTPSQREQQTPSQQDRQTSSHREQQTPGQQDRQMPGHRRRKNHNKNERKQMFTPHWTREMVSEGLKKGFLVEGTIRINPKNYEDAYIPGPDGISDIYISGFANRNRAMNGDTVAVLVNGRQDWRVFLDSFEEYEAQLEAQMKTLSLAQTDLNSAKNASVLPESMDYKLLCDSREESIQHSSSQSKTACSGTSQSEKTSQRNPLVQLTSDEMTTKLSADQADLSPIPNCHDKQDSAQAAGSKQKQGTHRKGNKTPIKVHQSKTPGSKGRYTSVKDLLSANGCSPVAKKLFSESKNEGEKAQGESEMSQFVQKTGTVVAVTEYKHSRACSGHIKPMSDKNQTNALFSPTDHRCPRIMVPLSDCPPDLLKRPEDHANTLFIARITDWPDTSQFAHGNIARSLGEAGLIEPETEGMLIEYDIDYSEFSPQVLTSLPTASPWAIPPEELAKRKDFRQHCIFTIDPATARDLDDALSCEDLGNGLFEVGVHIADVTYFLQEDTDLDELASRRATSVYLVQKVVPMLPRLLCEELCSLNPDQDRLTFSVIWHMNENAEIQGEWFGRSVIRSCVKMSYDHAQGFIDNPDREYTEEDLPPITNGFSVDKIKERVLNLHKLAQKLRKNRFDSGALQLDQVKLQFTLDKETGLPNGYSVYKQRESNKLVEEFMLLANMAVGHKILNTYPETALLRCHPPPHGKMLNDLYDLCINLEVPVDITSSGTLQRSLVEYQGEDDFTSARLQVLVNLCSKPMQNARYFCTGVIQDEDLFHHYALNVPVYTHFTSPIRRYADVITHRLLGASLGYSKAPQKTKDLVQKQADICNDRKLASKCVQERSSGIFFAVFVKEVGPLEEAAMVMSVLDRSFDIYVLKLGVSKRVYCEQLPLQSYTFRKDRKKATLTLVWLPTESTPDCVTQEITIFTMVTAVLKSDKEPLRWSATISHPDPEP
ncbi:DIS3-like exonuclease 2 [Liolophura sinensis]|uniref:DIS3-like exonuclease 2 n=1 Tax=Liolophura sinensis TaxID=3198878 RepID=UPI0031598903